MRAQEIDNKRKLVIFKPIVVVVGVKSSVNEVRGSLNLSLSMSRKVQGDEYY